MKRRSEANNIVLPLLIIPVYFLFLAGIVRRQDNTVELSFFYENKEVDLKKVNVFYIADDYTISIDIKDNQITLIDTAVYRKINLYFNYKSYLLDFPYKEGKHYYFQQCDKNKWVVFFEKRPFKKKKINYSLISSWDKVKFVYLLGCGTPKIIGGKLYLNDFMGTLIKNRKDVLKNK